MDLSNSTNQYQLVNQLVNKTFKTYTSAVSDKWGGRGMANVTIDTSGVSAKVAKMTGSALLAFLASEARKGLDQYVPFRSGRLAASATSTPGVVTYSTPYARRVYYGDSLNFSRDRHPKARARWDGGFKAAGGAKRLGESGTAWVRSHG